MENFEVGKVIVQKAEFCMLWEAKKLRKQVVISDEVTFTDAGTVATILGCDLRDPKDILLDISVGGRNYRTHVVNRNLEDVWVLA